jgi:transcriptional regulator with GAF, ATPase, and Fis domain
VILRAVGAGQGAVIARAGIEQELAAEMRSNASPAERPAPSAPESVSAATAWPFMLGDGSLPPGMPLPDAEREFQRFHIARALARHNGNKTRAARDLGMKLQTLHVRAQKLGLT